MPTIIAHRGFAGIAPENTVAAVRAAINAGAGGDERTGRWRPFVQRVLGILDDHEQDSRLSSFHDAALASWTITT